MKRIRTLLSRLLILPLAALLFLGLGTRAAALSGAGTEEDPYLLQTVEDLEAMHEHLDGYYLLANDMDVSLAWLTPIGDELEGPFTGTLDGGGHTITGLKLVLPDNKYTGLFGYLEGTVKNLKLAEVQVVGGRFTGAVAGEAGVGSLITDCQVLSGSVTSQWKYVTTSAGGIAGILEGDMVRCTNRADVTTEPLASAVITNGYPYDAGGIVGLCDGEDSTLKDCVNYGVVTAQGRASAYKTGTRTYSHSGTDAQAGGVAGRNEGILTMTGCVNYGQITAKSAHLNMVGGLMGENNGTLTAVSCRNAGEVCADWGLVTYYDSSYDLTWEYVGESRGGGLIGSFSGPVTMLNCANSGAVKGVDLTNYGSASTSNSYLSYIAGLAGRGSARLLLTDCENTGSLSGRNEYMYYYGISAGSGAGSLLTRCVNTGLRASDTPVLPKISPNQVTSLVFKPDTFTCPVGTETVLKPSVSPAGADTALEWTSGDERIATVSPEGLLTAKKPGNTVILVRSGEVSAALTVEVTLPAESIALDQQQLTLETGLAAQLKAAVAPAGSTSAVTWSSNAPDVAAVDEAGLVTAAAPGKAVITARTDNSLSAVCVVTVVPPAQRPQSIRLSQTALRPQVGEKVRLTAQLLPEDAVGREITWSSSDPAVASVTEAGVVEALAPGEAVIRAETSNGLYDICQVRVVTVSSAAFLVSSGRSWVGESFETDVHIAKNPGVASFVMELDYDPAAMTPTAVTAGDLLAAGTLTSNLEDPGKLRVVWYAAEDITEDGVLFTVSWTALDQAGTFELTPLESSFDVCNARQEDIRVSAEKGQVLLLDRPVGDIYRDGKVDMKDIVYLARWFVALETLDEGQTLAADLFYDGTVDVKDLSLLAQRLSEALPEDDPALMEAEPEQAFRVETADACLEEDRVTLTVTGSNCTGVAAMRFRLAAPQGFRIAEVVPLALLAEGTFSYNGETGIVTWYASAARELNGELFTVVLEKTGEAFLPAELELEYSAADFFSVRGYREVPVVTELGVITLAPYIRITDLSAESGAIAVAVDTNLEKGAVLVAAFYRNGQLLSTEFHTVTQGETTVTVSLPEEPDAVGRLFLLDPVSYAPLTDSRDLS